MGQLEKQGYFLSSGEASINNKEVHFTSEKYKAVKI